MSEFTKRMRRLKREIDIKPGDIYEDCAHHPVVCIGVDWDQDDVWGISLIDGTHPRSCSLLHCGVIKLTVDEAWRIKTAGPEKAADRRRIPRDHRWWRARSGGRGRG